MQEIHFEATVKDGYIKIPERYPGLNNRKVMVDISSKDMTVEEKQDRVEKASMEKKVQNNSPVQRLLNLAGKLENPEGLNARQYKQKIIKEYLSTQA
jgi:hypothetical protein